MKPLQFGGGYQLTRDESQRINLVKLISIFLVVLVHSSDLDFVSYPNLSGVMKLQYINDQIIGRSCIPMFYFSSGILLFKSVRDYGQVVRSKLRSLGIPYLFWNTVWILFFVVLEFVPFASGMFSEEFVPMTQRNFLQWLQLYGIGPDYPQAYQFWFIRDMMLCILISPILWKMACRAPWLSVALALGIEAFAPLEAPMSLAFPFMLMAAVMVRKDFHMSDLDRIPVWLTLVIYGAVGTLVYVTRLDPIRNLSHIVGAFAFIRLTALITGKPRAWLQKLAPSVFMVFAAHDYTLTCFKKLFYMVFPTTAPVVLAAYFILPCLVIALCLLADRILRRLLPRFHSAITGGR